MALELSPKIQQQIRERVESGKYPDADAVVAQALEQLEDYEKLQHLRALIAVGMEQSERGEVFEYNEDFRREAMESAYRRAAAGERPSPDVCP